MYKKVTLQQWNNSLTPRNRERKMNPSRKNDGTVYLTPLSKRCTKDSKQISCTILKGTERTSYIWKCKDRRYNVRTDGTSTVGSLWYSSLMFFCVSLILFGVKKVWDEVTRVESGVGTVTYVEPLGVNTGGRLTSKCSLGFGLGMVVWRGFNDCTSWILYLIITTKSEDSNPHWKFRRYQ